MMKKNNGVTGLGSFPLFRLNSVVVSLEKNGVGRTVEILEWFWGRNEFRNVLEGQWELNKAEKDDGTRLLVVKYEQAKLLWFGRLKAKQKAEMMVSWVGERVRIGRGRNGAVFVFEREK